MWTRLQRERLACERLILAKDMPQFVFYDMTGNTYVAGWQSTTSGRQNYHLTLVLCPRYPDKMPRLYVTSPKMLRQYNPRKFLNSEGATHRFHTLENSGNGFVQICHTRSDLWSPYNACIGVFLKGILWLEAYQGHLRTGKNLSCFLMS